VLQSIELNNCALLKKGREGEERKRERGERRGGEGEGERGGEKERKGEREEIETRV
jgi:hypothetical protein